MLDPDYFQILSQNRNAIELQSRCTGHFWRLTPNSDGTVWIYHKHHAEQQYHRQTVALDVDAAIEIIQDHDEYQLNGRKCKNTLYCRGGIVKNGRYRRY